MTFAVGSEHGQPLVAKLPPGTELTYGDVLRLFNEQNRESMARLTQEVMRRGEPQQALALSLPVLRQMLRERQKRAKTGEYDQRLREITWWLVDVYLF